MKEIFKSSIDKKIESVAYSDESVTFNLEGGTLEVSTYHDQDCCEHVYGDFSVFKYLSGELTGKLVGDFVVKGVEGMGFLIILGGVNKVFIPCYDYQNGYYSDALSITIKLNGVETKVDISDLVEHHID